MSAYYYNAQSVGEAGYFLAAHEASVQAQHENALARHPAMLARHLERLRREAAWRPNKSLRGGISVKLEGKLA